MADDSIPQYPITENCPSQPPAGTLNYDGGALSFTQSLAIENFKMKMRKANEKYLAKHPELNVMISLFLRAVFLKRPTDIHLFANEFFRDPILKLEVKKVEKKNQQEKFHVY